MLRIADGEDMGAREVGIGTHVEIGMLRSVQHSADEPRAATPATMTSLDAPVYNVLGQRVSPKTKGLVIYKGRKYVNN